MRRGLARYAPEISESGLTWVIIAFGTLIFLNLLTLAAGTTEVLARLNSNPLGAAFSPFVFDSWGTIGGLGGVVLLFGPLLFGTPVSQRRALSKFYLTASIGGGVLAALVWDAFYDTTGYYGSGSSSIAITSQGIIFGLSILGLARLARQDTRHLGELSSHWWYSLAIIYFTLVLTSLWFILSLEPIFVPTDLFNWRVHEFGFLLGIAAAVAFAALRWRGLGLDGVVRIDDMVLNFHYDDLCGRFPVRLPKYHVVFRRVPEKERAELHPERREIWVSEAFRSQEYGTAGSELERALLHAMVHLQLLLEGRGGESGASFDEIAKRVGATPES